MIFHSIRWRLQTWHGVILVAVLAGFGFTAYRVALDNQRRRIDQELEQELMTVVRPPPPGRPPLGPGAAGEILPRPPGAPLPRAERFRFDRTNAFYYVVWRRDGTVLAESLGAPAEVPFPALQRMPAPLGMGEGTRRERPENPPFRPPPHALARSRGQNRELFRSLPSGECILVGRSISADLAAMHRLAVGLIAAGAGVLGIGLAGGWWLATRAIGPIQDISSTAERIARGDLSQRINAADAESELGRLAQVLNSTFARLEAAFAQQARFTSDASHELRTPVAVILSQTQTALSRERNPAEYRETLEACQRAAQRMRVLTESLLELARWDAGQQPLKGEPFDLSELARESVDLIRPLAAERNVALHCDLQPGVACAGDAARVAQLLTNLLSNAVQFNRQGGEVHVRVSVEGGMARCRVSDTGTGIPAAELPHLFERFYRVDPSRSGGAGHAGLGLSICRAIVQAHGGTIEVSSEPGRGSSFAVSLPLAPA
jgi:two-component system OmpR family sensor kinase